MNASTMETIEGLAKVFAGARTELADRLNVLREEQNDAKRRRIQGIKNSLERVQASYEELKTVLSDNRALFDKPKTRVLHGIKLGWQKKPGKLEIADDAACIAALRKLLGDDADAYVKTTEEPIRKALANLPAKDLKRCGVAVTDDVDAVLIKAADGDLDKMIDALIVDPDLEAIR